MEKHILLRDLDVPNIRDLAVYSQHEGYAAWKKAVTGMKPDEVITVASDSHAAPAAKDAHATPAAKDAHAAPAKDDHSGEPVFVPLFRGANADLNTTFALAIIVMVFIHVMGIKSAGLSHHLAHF